MFILLKCENFLKVYLVTDNSRLNGRDFFEVVEKALLGGVTMVQLREKNVTSKEFYDKALKLKKLTERFKVPLIINDRADIALAVGADGVHIGQKDIPAALVRKMVGEKMILGVTASTEALALEAEKNGADYIGAGAVFSTSTKKEAKTLSREELKKITACVKIPVVAIGGISNENIESLRGSGIAGVAVSSGIMGGDAFESAKTMSKLMMG